MADRKLFEVRAALPEDVGVTDMATYIRDWVRRGRGSLTPDDPLFHLNPESVTVRPAGQRKPDEARMRKVRGCRGCPFAWSSMGRPWKVCSIDPDERSIHLDRKAPPSWCRLRTGPFSVSLVTT